MDRCLHILRHVRRTMTIVVILLFSLLPANKGKTQGIELGQIRAKISKCREFESRVVAKESRNQELAHRITQLKKSRTTDVATRNLQNLLRQSVQAANELESLSKKRSVAMKECESSLRDALRNIDALIGDEKAMLRSTSKETRIQSARKIRQLLNQRKELRKLETKLQTTSSTPKQWKQYQVEIDPLDGPQELREKAEFLEDTRDKLKRKRAKVMELLREKRQLLALAKAANQFATEVGAFDETIRRGRVERTGNTQLASGPPSVATNFSADGSPASPTRSSSNESVQNQASASSPEGASSTDLANDPSDLASGTQETSQKNSNPIGLSIQSPQQSASTLLNQISPDALVNLDVMKLTSGQFQFQDLEKIMSSLEKLDLYLKSQSTSIRTIAQKIEDDEKRALQK